MLELITIFGTTILMLIAGAYVSKHFKLNLGLIMAYAGLTVIFTPVIISALWFSSTGNPERLLAATEEAQPAVINWGAELIKGAIWTAVVLGVFGSIGATLKSTFRF